MAWGIDEPADFDDFFPGGNFVGRAEAIRAYWESLTEKEREGFTFAGGPDYLKFSEKYTFDRGPMAPAECPGHFDLRRKRKRLGDLIKTNERLLAVSAPLKEVIESLEPGVHQFWPMRITIDEGKQEWPASYFGMRIGQFINSFLPIEGTCRESKMPDNPPLYFSTDQSKEGYALLTLSGEKIGSAHLWRERRLQMPDVFMSDALQAAIKGAGLRIMKHYKVKVV